MPFVLARTKLEQHAFVFEIITEGTGECSVLFAVLTVKMLARRRLLIRELGGREERAVLF